MDVARRLLARARKSSQDQERTMLTTFFDRMGQIRNDPSLRQYHNMTYLDFPKVYRWDKTAKNWFPRAVGGRAPDIVKIGTVSANDKELLVFRL